CARTIANYFFDSW
nr:immunoglobulin heavy chain junction region [Macaca mulatta]